MTLDSDHIQKFRALIEEAIDYRENALFPPNPLFTLSQSINDQEITKKEQAVLICVLSQFDKIFGVE